MLRLLVDAQGEYRHRDNAARSLPQPEDVELRVTDGHVSVILDPRHVFPITIACTGELVLSFKPERVVLVALGERTEIAHFPTTAAAIEQLEALCRRRTTHHDWSCFHARRQSVGNLEHSRYNPIHLILAEWKILDRQFDEDMFKEFVARRETATTGLGFAAADGAGVVLVAGHLPGGRIIDRRWSSDALRRDAGLDLRDLPNRQYGAWGARTYLDVLVTQHPRLERVSVDLCSPELGRHRWDYDRLLLPWRMPDGRPAVTLTSIDATDRGAKRDYA